MEELWGIWGARRRRSRMLGARCCGDDMRWNVGRKRAGQLTRTSACRSTEIGATSGTEQQLQRRDHLREVPWLHVRGRVAGLLLLLCLLLEYLLLQGTRIPASGSPARQDHPAAACFGRRQPRLVHGLMIHPGASLFVVQHPPRRDTVLDLDSFTATPSAVRCSSIHC